MAGHNDGGCLTRHWRARIFGAAFSVVPLYGAVDGAEPAAPAVHVVTIENMRFSPKELTVKRGERIVWINKDLFPHTATAFASLFDSGNIPPNASWTYVADTAGVSTYVCTYHPTMNGKLTVR